MIEHLPEENIFTESKPCHYSEPICVTPPKSEGKGPLWKGVEVQDGTKGTVDHLWPRYGAKDGDDSGYEGSSSISVRVMYNGVLRESEPQKRPEKQSHKSAKSSSVCIMKGALKQGKFAPKQTTRKPGKGELGGNATLGMVGEVKTRQGRLRTMILEEDQPVKSQEAQAVDEQNNDKSTISEKRAPEGGDRGEGVSDCKILKCWVLKLGVPKPEIVDGGVPKDGVTKGVVGEGGVLGEEGKTTALGVEEERGWEAPTVKRKRTRVGKRPETAGASAAFNGGAREEMKRESESPVEGSPPLESEGCARGGGSGPAPEARGPGVMTGWSKKRRRDRYEDVDWKREEQGAEAGQGAGPSAEAGAGAA
eukprot:TRINITY_DN2403_c0_g2_i3.p1 TRINITY_DN2403_c0_g2~~TRINITY_DN2403_c0_g2_i3.p1  ORF type:complete len:405 (-),score=63.12 TRINITY_DN2403_c0_g2_i3:448-1539(-)